MFLILVSRPLVSTPFESTNISVGKNDICALQGFESTVDMIVSRGHCHYTTNAPVYGNTVLKFEIQIQPYALVYNASTLLRFLSSFNKKQHRILLSLRKLQSCLV